MKIVRYLLLFVMLLSPIYFVIVKNVDAQVGQIIHTIIGDPNQEPPSQDPDPGSGGGNPGGGGGSNDDLPVGIFKPPFACNITYGGSTYAGPNHVWEVDFNRRGCGDDRGDPVYAVAPGTAIGVSSSLGRVIIRHKGGYYSLYGHMQNIKVRNNQQVKLRQLIGHIGSVGTGSPHLHFGQYRYAWPNLVKVKFDGKGHPASLPGNRTIDANRCIQVGFVNCRVLY